MLVKSQNASFCWRSSKIFWFSPTLCLASARARSGIVWQSHSVTCFDISLIKSRITYCIALFFRCSLLSPSSFSKTSTVLTRIRTLFGKVILSRYSRCSLYRVSSFLDERIFPILSFILTSGGRSSLFSPANFCDRSWRSKLSFFSKDCCFLACQTRRDFGFLPVMAPEYCCFSFFVAVVAKREQSVNR